MPILSLFGYQGYWALVLSYISSDNISCNYCWQELNRIPWFHLGRFTYTKWLVLCWNRSNWGPYWLVLILGAIELFLFFDLQGLPDGSVSKIMRNVESLWISWHHFLVKKYARNEDNAYPISPEYRTISPMLFVERFDEKMLRNWYLSRKHNFIRKQLFSEIAMVTLDYREETPLWRSIQVCFTFLLNTALMETTSLLENIVAGNSGSLLSGADRIDVESLIVPERLDRRDWCEICSLHYWSDIL